MPEVDLCMSSPPSMVTVFQARLARYVSGYLLRTGEAEDMSELSMQCCGL